jgi:Glycosyl hydrolases family 39
MRIKTFPWRYFIFGTACILSSFGGSDETMSRAASISTPAVVPAPTTVIADYSKATDQPLIKDKIGVYQTPFMGTAGIAPLMSMQPFLVEAGVRDLRYEIAWGKPDTFAYQQIGGTASSPTIDFSQLDPFLTMLHANGVQPLLAVGYDPLPLQICNTANCWKAAPTSYAGWQIVLSRISSHYAHDLGLSGVQYEMWNEPDISIDGAKIFFTGNVRDYGNIYRYGVAGVQQGASNAPGLRDALVGGPAIAFDTTYITGSGMLQQPLDFLSIHAYANYESQISSLRAVSNSSAPLYMTEYGSYKTFGIKSPLSTHMGAMQFFADVSKMLNDPDVTKIYWAQWIDDSLGMITYSQHRKAIFNAYKIYQTMLPVDRVSTTISDTTKGIGTMAGCDAHTAGIVIWNSSATAQPVIVQMKHLPFSAGTLQQWYIDQSHASYEDNATESLTASGDTTAQIMSQTAAWAGTVQPQSLIYIHATDGDPSLLTANAIGNYGGDHSYFSNHPSAAYADFDPRTSIARLGMGTSETGAAVVANVYDVATSARLNVAVAKSGPYTPTSANGIFGVRVDYMNTSGAYDKAVLYTDGLYNAHRTLAFSWGTGTAVPNVVIPYVGTSFQIDLAGNAPADWDGKRITITPMLEDAGTESKAVIRFTIAKN